MIRLNSQHTNSQNFDIVGRAMRFCKCESGALSSEFAVVAALMAALGVTFYETTATGSRQLVTNTGFVIQNDGPNYSIDGSGPIGEYTYASNATDEAPADEVGQEDLVPTAEETLGDTVYDTSDTENGGTETADNTDQTTGEGTETADNGQTADTGTEGTETADNGQTADTGTEGTETADNGETPDTGTEGTETADTGTEGTETGGTETADAGDTTGTENEDTAANEEPELPASCYTNKGKIKAKCL